MTPLPPVKFGPHTVLGRLTTAGYEFGYMAPEEYGEVLALRRHAYVRAGKFPKGTHACDMADPPDREARVIVAKFGGVVVGAASVLLAGPGTKLVHEKYLAVLPEGVPAPEETVEVSKLCAHPFHWGTGLFEGLLTLAGLVILAAGRRYALLSAAGRRLVETYERFGMRRLGVSYVHPTMQLTHDLMLMDVTATVEGRAEVNPLFWNVVGCWELWRFGRACRAVQGGLRPLIWRLLAPLAALMLVFRAARRSRKRR